MKTIEKTTYILSCFALMLASCSQEDMAGVHTDGEDRRIVFNTSLPEITTKSTEIVKELTNFRLTAFDETDSELREGEKINAYFYNKKLEKAAGTDNKVISDECVWPDPGKESDKLHFFAYYPELKSESFALANDDTKPIDYQTKDFQIANGIADQVDFVTAYATGSMAENLFSGISLNFRHQLSRIEVKAKGAHKSCNIQIAGVRIANAYMVGDFAFPTSVDADGVWSNTTKGIAEYIFHDGDPVVKVGQNAVSIMGKKIDEDTDNCAMLIPSTYSGWDYSGDTGNENEGMYLSVLLRVLDKTSKDNKQQYPYYDNSQGLNAMDIPVVYLVVDKTAETVTRRVYKSGASYFSDENCTESYTIPAGAEVRAFGWASLPITGEWEPGYTYTYTLDYTSGVGVHGPETPGETSPKAGDPVISDKVGVTIKVNSWGSNTTTQITVLGS